MDLNVVEVAAPNCYKEPEDPKPSHIQNVSKKSSRGTSKDPGEKYSNGGTSKSNGSKHSESIPSIVISS
ncbi:hypothetical protein Anas_08964 [Armadillidium nasatum]|uniref:Uncharacterized protein n=1 Tax=Armadillidium nasatum TaxID=96803 RepID=A0A5N5T1C3_9CRUS|nr:hypothetical protein Anas_08964 [Armadillidium nasatum]